MDFLISSTEVGQIAIIKLFFYLFVILGLVLFFKLKKPVLFVSLVSIFLVASYLSLIWGAQLTWWGLQGDEIFVTAFLEKVASGQFFSDFFYSSLPPFYPPLYFWLIGGLAFLFNFNGVLAAQLGVAFVLLITPFLVYWWQKLFWRNLGREKIDNWSLVLTAALIFVVLDWTAVILKPYEFLAAVLVIFWTAFLLQEIHFKTLDLKKVIFYSISGGLLFLLFYFWFFFVVLAIALFKLFTELDYKYYLSRLGIIAAAIILISLPYSLPLAISYLRWGTENWQPAFFIVSDLNLYLPFFQFSIFGLMSLAGLLTLILYWPKPYVKALASIFISIYLWQAANLVTTLFFQAPFLAAKPFIFLGGAVLSISAGYGISQIIKEKIKNQKFLAGLFVAGWIILATQLLGGNFIDDPKVQEQLVRMKQPLREEFVNLIFQLKPVSGIEDLTILSGASPEISAFVSLNYYVSYNAHFSHPAANFTQRYLFINQLALSRNSADFYQKLKQAPFQKIDGLLFLKGPGFYPLYFWLDDYIYGGREEEIRIPADLLTEQYFAKVFEDEHFVFYRVK